MVLMASTSPDVDSDGDAEDDDEVFSELNHEELITAGKNHISNYHSKSKSFKILKKQYELLF